MPAERPGFPFRIFLPLVQLLVCLALLWPHLPGLRDQLSHTFKEIEAKVLQTETPEQDSTIVLDVTAVAPRRDQPLDLDAVRLTAPAALNIPVGFVQIPFILANPERSEWTPKGMWIREWRAVSWPFVGVVFWWMAGRALESISAGMRFAASSRAELNSQPHLPGPTLHSIELAIGAALVGVGGATCYVMASGQGLLGLATDYVLAAGAGLWAVFGLIIIIAGIVQWRVRLREKLARAEAAGAV